MMTLEERIRRGDRAKALLSDPMLKDAAEHIEAECWRVFKALGNDDLHGLQEVKRLQYLHSKYITFLRDAMVDGEQAKLDVEHRRKYGLRDMVTAIRGRLA